jgi:hypothetical protein
VRIAGSLHANNGHFNEALAAEGMGIAREPDFIVGPDVRAGRLTPILRGFEPPPLNIYVVYPSRRHLSAKVRAFADFLVERFATPEWGLPAAENRRSREGRAARERNRCTLRGYPHLTQRRTPMTQPSGGHSGSAALRGHYLARIAWLRTSGMSALLVLLVSVVFILPALIPFGTEWHVHHRYCSGTDPGFGRRGL